MKLDLSGLQSFPSIPGGAVDDLGVDLFAAPSFQLPACSDFDGFQKDAIQMVKPAKGTTTLAFIFKEGVIVAADSRASMGGYISSCGAFLTVYHVGPDGWKKLSGDDVGELHYKYYPVAPTPVEQEMTDAPAA
ncbi:hypothetical protein GW17_00053342 [Ensete ventricosum]|nr:hypothetical protein GW17_00053342 [Ensete ventricosum]RZS28726.1 hypothetical protein BHM03_00062366 [Ensete ventricosum]